MRWIALAAIWIACGGGATSAPAPVAASAPAEPTGADGLPGCYPYVARDGACLTRCDYSNADKDDATDPDDDCAQDDWPHRCNADGTCTPEPPPQQP